MIRFYVFEKRGDEWDCVGHYLNVFAAVLHFVQLTETIVPRTVIAATVRAAERFATNSPDGVLRMIVSDERPLLLPHPFERKVGVA